MVILKKPLARGIGMVSAIALTSVTHLSAVQAQTLIHAGEQQFELMQIMSEEIAVQSRGVLADLETDPNFDGDFDFIFDEALGILEGYTIVSRGGHFPENYGIPLDEQLTVAETVYRQYRLDNGLELMLYRSPMENTSRYFIRRN